MKISDVVSDAAVLSLNLAQREALSSLLNTEREHATKWWTFLNEMRCRGELPDWVKKQGIGSHPDYDRMEEDRIAFNSALFGKRRHIHVEGEPVFVSTFFSADSTEQTGR